jgi:hypothetical protein
MRNCGYWAGYRGATVDSMLSITQTPVVGVGERSRSLTRYVPGLLLCAAAVAVSMTVNHVLPGVSPLIVAIVLGIGVTNLVALPEVLSPGITVAAKKLLRLGIVFLGLKLVLSDIIGLGAPMLGVIVCIVGGGILGTVAIGRLLNMRPAQALLIACGFSICGAAAVAGVEGVTDAEEEDTVTAVALVVIFGTPDDPDHSVAGAGAGYGRRAERALGRGIHPRDRPGRGSRWDHRRWRTGRGSLRAPSPPTMCWPAQRHRHPSCVRCAAGVCR